MLTSFLSVLTVLAVVLIGMLVMLRAIRLEPVVAWILRALMTAFGLVLALCLLRSVVLPISIALLVWLRQSLLWFAIVGLAVVAVAISIAVRKVRSQQHGTDDE